MARVDGSSQLDKALRGLRSLVMNGGVTAHDRLPEVALAERLGISRTPLRQAMDRLVAEGLLERIETGGCRVARFTLDDIIDAIELRGVIEGTAARLAAERGADPALLRDAEVALDAIDVALRDRDLDAYVLENARFHALLARLAGSAVIRREAERVHRLPLASPSAFLQEQELVPDFHASLQRAQGQHRAILGAIRAREGTRAEALTREHARLARQNLDYLTRADPALTTDIVKRVPGLALVTQD